MGIKIRWKFLVKIIIFIAYLYSNYYLFEGFCDYYDFLSEKSDAKRRDQIRQVMQDAWNSYSEYAWGYDFLNPQTRCGEDLYGLGYTIIDSLDTLLLMGMTKEFNEAVSWINNTFQHYIPYAREVSFFETVIRSVGGLLSAYEQSGNQLLLKTAAKLADRLISSFNTSSGLPRVLVDVMALDLYDHPWANKSSLLADAGSCQIEFLALSQHTGNPEYFERSMNARRKLLRFGPIPPTQLFYHNLWPSISQFSFDAFGDSYFEYLLKLKLYAPFNVSEQDRPLEFRHAIEEAINRLAFSSWKTGRQYFTTATNDEFTHTVSHLSFFLPGTLFLAAQQDCIYNKLFFCRPDRKKCRVKNPDRLKTKELAKRYLAVNKNRNKNINDFDIGISAVDVHFARVENETEDGYECDFDFDCDCECQCDFHSSCSCSSVKYHELYLNLANNLLETAVHLYKMQPTKLGGESARFTNDNSEVSWIDDTYKLRPELVESLFYSWRIIHNVNSKMFAWKIFKAIKKYCKTDAGFTTVHQTSTPVVIFDNLQDSFFLSETLKYLYLIFSDDDVFSLDEYVFTTQAHPLKKLLFRK